MDRKLSIIVAAMSKSHLLIEIESFLASSGMAATTFGQKSVHEWRLVERLRDGGDVTTRTAERIRTFIAAHAAENSTPRRPSGSGRVAA